MRLGQEDGARPEMIAAYFRSLECFGVVHISITDDRQTIPMRLEWRKAGWRKVEIVSDLCRRPKVFRRTDLRASGSAMHHLYRNQPRFRGWDGGFRRRAGSGHHCLQER